MQAAHPIPPARSRQNKIIILLILAIAAAPLLASAWLVFSGWEPAKSRKHGEWVEQQPYFLRALTLVNEAGEPLKPEHFHKKWVLLFFTAANANDTTTAGQNISAFCDATCEKKLYAVRQSVLAQSLQAERIISAWVRLAPAAPSSLPAVLPSTLKSAVDFIEPLRLKPVPSVNPALASWLQQAPQQGLYVIDPEGRAVLHFPNYTSVEDLRGMVKDLMQLLKVSQIG